MDGRMLWEGEVAVWVDGLSAGGCLLFKKR